MPIDPDNSVLIQKRVFIGNIRGPQGFKGDRGEKGDSFYVNDIQVEVDTEYVPSEPPTVTVERSGPSSKQIWKFTFHNLRGEQGPMAALSGASATVDNLSSNHPTVDVTLEGEPGNQELVFAFSGLKGEGGSGGGSVDIPIPLPVEMGGTNAETVEGIYETLDIVPILPSEIDAFFV